MQKLIFICLFFCFTKSLGYDYLSTVESNVTDENMIPYIKTYHLITAAWLQSINTSVKKTDKITLAKNSLITYDNIDSIRSIFDKKCGSNFFLENIKNIDYRINTYNYDVKEKKKYFLITIYNMMTSTPTLKIQFRITFSDSFTNGFPEVYSIDIVDSKNAKIIPSNELIQISKIKQ